SHRSGITYGYNSACGIIQDVLPTLDIGLWIRCILESHAGIEDCFIASLDLSGSIEDSRHKFWLAECRPAVSEINEIGIVLQNKRFLGCEDLIQIVGTRANPEMTMFLVPFFEICITQVCFLLGNVLTKGGLIRNVGFARSLVEILGQDLEAGSTHPTCVFNLGSIRFILGISKFASRFRQIRNSQDLPTVLP